ncbi:hypothetical protein K2X05_07770 [bacterium]|nr:hypothetical protein [bacterium]
MSRFEDFFDKNPPEHHQQRVEIAVKDVLLHNRQLRQKRHLFIFGAAALSSAFSALFVFRFLKDTETESSFKDPVFQFADLEREDFEMLTEMEELSEWSDEDFELLMNASEEKNDA